MVTFIHAHPSPPAPPGHPVFRAASARAETRGNRWTRAVNRQSGEKGKSVDVGGRGQLALETLLGVLSTEAQAVLAELHSTLSSRVQGGIRAS